jgi:hypothetical protein
MIALLILGTLLFALWILFMARGVRHIGLGGPKGGSLYVYLLANILPRVALERREKQ